MTEYDLDTTLEHIEEHGYALLEGLIPEERAAQLAETVLRVSTDTPAVDGYAPSRALLNHDAAFAELMIHPFVLNIAHYLIGGRTEPAKNVFVWPKEDRIRVEVLDGLICRPGSVKGSWHLDPPMSQSTRQGNRLPDRPQVVNVVWILTPFTVETGATRLLPGSHRHRETPPATNEDLDGQIYMAAGPGSAMILPNLTWHASGGNQTDRDRVGVTCFYTPIWISRILTKPNPVNRDAWDRLPPEAQNLTQHQLLWPESD